MNDAGIMQFDILRLYISNMFHVAYTFVNT